jgi:hypothetical protein
MQSFPRNYRLAADDLNIVFINNVGFYSGSLVNYSPYWVSYEIGYVDSNLLYHRIGPENRVPEKRKEGTYRANFIVGDDWRVADYKIIWKYKIGQFSPTLLVDGSFRISYCYSGGDPMGLIVVIGASDQGVTGVQGIQYNPVVRYQAITTANEEVWITSSSAVHTGLPWTRTGTNLEIVSRNHGLAIGDMVIARQVNVEEVSSPVSAITSDSFVITVPNSGAASGIFSIYNVGMTFTHTGNPKTGGVLSLPSGNNSDIQITSLRIRTGTRSSTTYELVVPISLYNNFGGNTSLGTTYVPSYSVRQDVDNLPAVGATIATNIFGSYATFRLANLGAPTQSRYIILEF